MEWFLKRLSRLDGQLKACWRIFTGQGAKRLAPVVESGNGVEHLAIGGEYFRFIANLLAQQGLGHWSIDTDPAFFGIDLVMADDSKLDLFPIFIF